MVQDVYIMYMLLIESNGVIPGVLLLSHSMPDNVRLSLNEDSSLFGQS